MALTVKHLNGDASFMLTFEALLPDQPPFRILIDPWITGKSKIFHSKISVTTHKEPPCITSLRELPEPDLVIISQNKSDHCNEDSLRQLPAKNTKTIILAEPASARTIRGWKYFEKGKVQTIPRWGDQRVTGRQSVVRVRVPSVAPGQVEPGEVTVAFIPQRRDISGLHGAIGITYRPPQAMMPPPRPGYNTFSNPPTTPRSHRSYNHLRPPPTASPPVQNCPITSSPYPPTPVSPTNSTLRSVRSASSLATTMRDSRYSTASFSSLDRPLSVIFSPHGINYASLHSYTTSHLVAEAALPLTALLHCFDSVSNPWWLGGNILLGAPAGIEIASRLGARAWISTHDGDKVVKGIATGFLRTRKWREEDVLGAMSSAEMNWRREKRNMKDLTNSTATLPNSPTSTIATTIASEKVRIGTDIIRLRSGEEVMLSNAPTLMIDHDGPTTASRGQDAPAIVTLARPQTPAPIPPTYSKVPSTPAPPVIIPPPRSLNRPRALQPLNAKKSVSEMPDAHPVENYEKSEEHETLIVKQTSDTEKSTTNTSVPVSAPESGPAVPEALRTILDVPSTITDANKPDASAQARTHLHENNGKTHEAHPVTRNSPVLQSRLEPNPQPKITETTVPIIGTTAPPTPPPATTTTTIATQKQETVITPKIPFPFPDIPPSFTEKRWKMAGRSRSGIRGRGNNKTQSESDFASFEEIMMMMRDS